MSDHPCTGEVDETSPDWIDRMDICGLRELAKNQRDDIDSLSHKVSVYRQVVGDRAAREAVLEVENGILELQLLKRDQKIAMLEHTDQGSAE